MACSYIPYEPDQDFLLPPSMREWLLEGHLAFFINDTVDALDLAAFHARYDKGGPCNQPYHPAMMIKVLLYGYASGVFSSRKIAAKLHEDVAFRVLAAGNSPAHRTIRDFRAFHLKKLQFSLRGLHRADAEWKLVCTALNLRRMCAFQAI